MLLKERETKLDPRVKRTRKLLQQAFQALLTEKEFQNITVQDVAERADVNRATFYAHFEDKYALLSYSVRGALEERLQNALPETPVLTVTNLRLLMETVFEFMFQFFGHCFPIGPNTEHILIGAQVQQYLYELLVEWMSRSPLKDEHRAMTPDHAAMVTSWIIFGMSVQLGRENRKQMPPQLADDILSMLTTGIAPYFAAPAGRQFK